MAVKRTTTATKVGNAVRTPATGTKKAAAGAAARTTKTTKTTAAPATTTEKTTNAKQSTATKSAAKTTKKTAAKGSAKSSAKKVSPASLPVREGESAWTAAEVREVRAELEGDVEQLSDEIRHAESDLVDLMRDSGDGAGDDEADAGAKTYEREQEISLANNAREMLEQTEHALERLDSGTYGTCESCGDPIGKMRLQAAPRATLCMPCKTKQERR